jgi:protein phosphatase
MIIDVAGVSHIGNKRSENQDSYLAERLPSTTGRPACCLAIADGMGGHEQGQRASEEAIVALIEELAEFDPTGFHPFTEGWCCKVEQLAHERVRGIAEEGEIVGTTFTILMIQGTQAVFGHVGDSRIYRCRDGVLEQLTVDQTWEEYAREHRVQNPHGNALRQAIGVGGSIDPVTGSVSLEPGDWVLVCSDGLSKMIDDQAVAKVLRKAKSAQNACDQLLEQALRAGGRDNVSVCVGRLMWKD